MAIIDSILARAAMKQTPVATGAALKLCVVACDDAALTGQLDAALRLKPGEAPIIRLPAGSGAISEELIQRAVAKAVYVEGCEEVLLVTHSACTLNGLGTDQLIEAIQRRGISRSAIPFDLRELVGAGRDPRQAVMDSAQALRRCPFLPASLLVHVGHLDEATGALQLVEHGQAAKASRPPSTSVPLRGTESISGYLSGPVQPLESSIASIPFELGPLPSTDTLQLPVSLPELPAKAVFVVSPAPSPVPPPPLSKQPLAPNLRRAMDAVRAFVQTELPKKERQWVKAALNHASEEGQSAEALVKIALQPVLKTGERRYRIIDEMLTVKDEVSKMPPARALAILRGIVE